MPGRCRLRPARARRRNRSLPTRSLNHLTSRVVLPKPAGAERSVSLRPASRVEPLVSRGRATSLGRACDGRSLVDTSESDAPIILELTSDVLFY